MHDVEAIFHRPLLLTISGYLKNSEKQCMSSSDARETAICSFTGITKLLIAVYIGHV